MYRIFQLHQNDITYSNMPYAFFATIVRPVDYRSGKHTGINYNIIRYITGQK